MRKKNSAEAFSRWQEKRWKHAGIFWLISEQVLFAPPRLHAVYFVQPQPAETMNISSLKQVHGLCCKSTCNLCTNSSPAVLMTEREKCIPQSRRRWHLGGGWFEGERKSHFITVLHQQDSGDNELLAGGAATRTHRLSVIISVRTIKYLFFFSFSGMFC